MLFLAGELHRQTHAADRRELKTSWKCNRGGQPLEGTRALSGEQKSTLNAWLRQRGRPQSTSRHVWHSQAGDTLEMGCQ